VDAQQHLRREWSSSRPDIDRRPDGQNVPDHVARHRARMYRVEESLGKLPVPDDQALDARRADALGAEEKA